MSAVPSLPHPSEPASAPGNVEIKVAAGLDDLMRAFAIRSAVYLAEQSCPYDEEFDGNDATATHLLGFVDGEPAATLRIRYFGSFVKVERMAVRREYRTSRVGSQLFVFAADFIKRKGFPTILGQVQEGRENYWAFSARRIGTKLEKVGGTEEFEFSGHSYQVRAMRLGSVEGAFDESSDPMVLNRPEGDWDRPGVLETGAGVLPTPTARLRA